MRRYIVALAFLICAFSGFACDDAQSQASSAPQNAHLKTLPVFIKTSSGKKLSLIAEVADTDKTRELGLMNRRHMATDAGMIFIFSAPDQRIFWMKNTYLSLDLLFISPAKEVIYIARSATPLSEAMIGPNSSDVQYVLELNAGYCDKNGVNVGDKVEF